MNQYFITTCMARKHIQLFILVLSSYRGNVSSVQAESKQISLEKQLQVLRETDHMLQVLKESLGELDKQLTTYLTDRIDAFQLPQEAQVLLQSSKPLCSERERFPSDRQWPEPGEQALFMEPSLLSSCSCSLGENLTHFSL